MHEVQCLFGIGVAVERCMAEGLVGGEGFAIDASVIKADANRSRKTAGDESVDLRDPRHATRAVREYLAALDEQGEPITPPASISPTDPAARWTAAPGGPAFYAYSTNYLVDVEAGIIVDVEATPALRTDEVNSTRTMIERVEERFNLKPKRLSCRQVPQTRMAKPSEEKSLSLSGQPVRLPGLPVETQVLSQHGDPQD
jgi:hypothetical protein